MKAIQFFLLSPLLLFSCLALAQTASHTATISGKLSSTHEGDSVILKVYKYGNFAYNEDSRTTYKTKIAAHSFSFTIPTSNHPIYVDLVIDRRVFNRNLFSYLLEGGENIQITETEGNYQFSGRGAASWNAIYQVNQIGLQFQATDPLKAKMKHMKDFLVHMDSSILAQLHYLDTQQISLSPEQWIILKGDVLGHWEDYKYANLHWWYLMPDSVPQLRQAIAGYHDYLFETLKFDSNGPIRYSDHYQEGLISKLEIDSSTLTGKQFSVADSYRYLKRNYRGTQLEKLLTYLIYYRKNRAEDLSPLVNDALTIVKNEDFRALLVKLKANRMKGAKAYNFDLVDMNGKHVRLADFKGKAVLMDFWFTGCGACRELAPKLKSIEEKFKGQNVVFLSISVDVDREKWMNSVKSGIYSSEIAINLFTNRMGYSHPLIKNYQVNAYPTLILIDKNGNLTENPSNVNVDGGKGLTSLIEKNL